MRELLVQQITTTGRRGTSPANLVAASSVSKPPNYSNPRSVMVMAVYCVRADIHLFDYMSSYLTCSQSVAEQIVAVIMPAG